MLGAASLGLAAIVVLRATSIQAQVARSDSTRLEVTTTLDTSRYLAAYTNLEFSLSRPLTPDDGALVMLVGGMDVSALMEQRGDRLVYRPTVAHLPAGSTEVIIYQKRETRWTELRRLSLKVLTEGGFTRVAVTPTSTLGNKGQLFEGRSRAVEKPERATFQDFVLNVALNTAHEAPRFSLETSSNYVGVSRREEALRFDLKGAQAPRFDLSDYRVALKAGALTFAVGNTQFGASRHLASGFASRGATLEWSRGATQLSVAALNAAQAVGWDNPVGINQPRNRVMGVAMGREMLPRRPGALRLDATLMDASRLPVAGVTQGAVVDAEQNAGASLQVTAASPGDRVRVAAGYARSRFDNPTRDGQLTGDTVVRAVTRETRGARFVEVTSRPLKELAVPHVGTVSADVSWRHERIDPLYRSVTAPMQADRQQDATEATLTVGAVSTQLGWTRSRDNLDRLATLLTTLGDVRTANVAVPLVRLLPVRRIQGALPLVTVAVNRTHQRGDAVAQGDLIRPTDIPDQLTTIRDVGAVWQVRQWRIGLKRNRSRQDNRQAEREDVDFASGSDVFSVGREFGAFADLALDLGKDFQRAEQRDEQTDVRRATLNVNLRRGQSTSLVLAASLMHTQPPTGPASLNGEQRVELTQPITVLRDAAGSARGQLFLRFGRSTSLLPDLARGADGAMPRIARQQWVLASGFNLRIL